jgi:hypothetical protein
MVWTCLSLNVWAIIPSRGGRTDLYTAAINVPTDARAVTATTCQFVGVTIDDKMFGMTGGLQTGSVADPFLYLGNLSTSSITISKAPVTPTYTAAQLFGGVAHPGLLWDANQRKLVYVGGWYYNGPNSNIVNQVDLQNNYQALYTGGYLNQTGGNWSGAESPCVVQISRRLILVYGGDDGVKYVAFGGGVNIFDMAAGYTWTTRNFSGTFSFWECEGSRTIV